MLYYELNQKNSENNFFILFGDLIKIIVIFLFHNLVKFKAKIHNMIKNDHIVNLSLKFDHIQNFLCSYLIDFYEIIIILFQFRKFKFILRLKIKYYVFLMCNLFLNLLHQTQISIFILTNCKCKYTLPMKLKRYWDYVTTLGCQIDRPFLWIQNEWKFEWENENWMCGVRGVDGQKSDIFVFVCLCLCVCEKCENITNGTAMSYFWIFGGWQDEVSCTWNEFIVWKWSFCFWW